MSVVLKSNKYIVKQEQPPQLVVNTSGIPLLSFFTGAGFLDIGFKQAGFNTIWCNEYNE